jgi:hypothetical protein
MTDDLHPHGSGSWELVHNDSAANNQYYPDKVKKKLCLSVTKVKSTYNFVLKSTTMG